MEPGRAVGYEVQGSLAKLTLGGPILKHPTGRTVVSDKGSLRMTDTVASADRQLQDTPSRSHLTDTIQRIPDRRVSRSLHKCSLDAAEREKMQSNLRSYTRW